MWPFNKKTEYNSKEDYNIDPLWYVKKLYEKNFNSKDNWGYMDIEEWDGFINNQELLPFMEKKGWIYVSHSSIIIDDHGVCVEIVFRRI